jgi:hypothetical protein
MNNKICRLLDANCNRAKEGLRVAEDITRFIISDKKLTGELKDIRHDITLGLKELPVDEKKLIESRSIEEDVGRRTTADEINKKDIRQILFANFQRAEESLRVLEEITKVEDKKKSAIFKDLRYRVYEIEKRISEKIPALPDKQ